MNWKKLFSVLAVVIIFFLLLGSSETVTGQSLESKTEIVEIGRQ